MGREQSYLQISDIHKQGGLEFIIVEFELTKALLIQVPLRNNQWKRQER